MLSISTIPTPPFGQNTRILAHDEDNTAVLVDPGLCDFFLQPALEQSGCTLTAILITHMHIDHICGIPKILEKYPEVKVYGPHIGDKPLLEHVNVQASMFGVEGMVGEFTPQWVEDGQVLQLFKDASFKVIHTPGHSPGSVCYHCVEENFILTGDTVFQDGFGRYDLEGGNRQQLRKSIEEHIITLPDNIDIMSGHGDDTTTQEFKSFYEKYGKHYL